MQRPLLILDIDETLIHGTARPLERACDFTVGEYHIYLRPHAVEFIKSVSAFYDLACWSSATASYLDEILPELVCDVPPLSFIWDRSRCTRRLDPELHEVYFLKDLSKVKRKGIDLDRVLILEDEPRKVARSFGNAVIVKPFVGELPDDELIKLGKYLEAIHKTDNFRKLEKRLWRSQVID